MVIRDDYFDFSFFSKNDNKIINSFYNKKTTLLNDLIEKYKDNEWLINTSLSDNRFDCLVNKQIKDMSILDMKLLSYYYKGGMNEKDLLIFYDLKLFDKAAVLVGGKILKGSNNNAGTTVGQTRKQISLWLSQAIGRYLKLYKSILSIDANFNELYFAYKKNDYVAKNIFHDLVAMIEKNIKAFLLLFDPNYIILGAGNFKLKRQLLTDIVEVSPYIKQNLDRIKLDVRSQNTMLGLLV